MPDIPSDDEMYPPVTPDLPWLSRDESWGDAPAEALGALHLLKCPVCGTNYNHHNGARLADGEDHYRAWMGRGDLLNVSFWCEGGHYWSLRIGAHKGELFVYATHDGDRPDDVLGDDNDDIPQP
jgi:hypothetical protein